MDDTIERRWGPKIAARGIYRDPVRSSHGHFVKASGLRWLSFMVLAPVPWAKCIKALPVLTLLCPSERYDKKRGRKHKLLTDWARQGVLQLCRWLPGRDIIFVGDSSLRFTPWLRLFPTKPSSSHACAWMQVCLLHQTNGTNTRLGGLHKRACHSPN